MTPVAQGRGLAPLFTSGRADWRTPRGVFDSLHGEFSFTLDACATDESACLPHYFTERDEGLMQSWAGERVFCNPPYGRQLRRWAEKVWNEAHAAALIVCLVPARTDTSWWHDYFMRADEIRFLRGRLSFDDDGGRAPFPSCLVIFRQPI